ncbi:hypothetical protein D3C72_1168770 [compost metagenome]
MTLAAGVKVAPKSSPWTEPVFWVAWLRASKTLRKPRVSMASPVRTETGATPSRSTRRMREPVTTTSSTVEAASGSGVSA